jgi:hypothetical protein
MDRMGQGPAVVVERLLAAINAHDLEAMVACFADDYLNQWPAHPQRGFQGAPRCARTGARSSPACPTSKHGCRG